MLKLPRLPASPAERFRCEYYSCNLFGSECVKRQTTTKEWRGANQHTGQFTKKYVPGHLQHCASGECQQGKEVAAIVGDVEVKDVKEERRRIATEAGRATVAAIEEKLAEAPTAVEATRVPDEHGLSGREVEILQLVVKGLENAEIGRVLAISKSTVRTHLEHVYTKLDVTNRVEATTEAIRLGLTEDAQLDEVEQVLEETAADPPPAMEPAPPAEEKKMGSKGPKSPLDSVTDEEFRKAFLGADGKIERLRKQYGAAHSTTARRADALGLRASSAKPTRKAKKAPTLADVVKKHASRAPLVVDAPYRGPTKPDDDVVVLLQQKRQHHLDQAARIDKALAALREVG